MKCMSPEQLLKIADDVCRWYRHCALVKDENGDLDIVDLSGRHHGTILLARGELQLSAPMPDGRRDETP